MPTERGIGLLVAASVLWTAARTFGVDELQMAAVATLTLLVLAHALVWLAPGRLEVRRRLRPDRIHADEHAVLSLEIINRGRLPSPPMQLRDTLPSETDAVTRLPMLRPGAATRWTSSVAGKRRGRSLLGPAVTRLTDPFGLAVRSRTLPGTIELVVYPRIVTLPPGLPLGGGSGVSGRPGSRPRPTSNDLADLREYVRGDDLRAVHWKSTAHRGKLMVRTGQAPEDARAVVVLDRRADRHTGDGEHASFETAVSAAASVVRHLTDRGRAVALVDEPCVEPPTPAPWPTSLARLAEVDTAEVDLPGLLGQLGQGIAGDGVLVAVVTAGPPAELQALVRAGRGFSTRVALVVDVASHQGRPDTTGRTEHARQGLRAAGWRVTVLRAGDPIDARWQELLLASRAAVAR